MPSRKLILTLLLLATITGCRLRNWRDRHYLNVSYQRNQQQQQQTIRTASVPPPPQEAAAAPAVFDSAETRGEEAIALHEAIEIALSDPSITRVTRGSTVTASAGTFYDVEISEERVRAALAAFDTRFESEFYTNSFNNPPNAFFGPGLAQPESRDEASITSGLQKPLTRGGLLSAAYNPRPGYFFEPNSTSTSGFNPRYVSELEISIRQPILRNAGLQVNIAPIQVAQLQVQQSAWDFKTSLIESVRSVVEAYWDLYAARVAVEQYDDVIPVLDEIVRIQQESFQAKMVIAADVAKAQGQLYQYQQDYLRLQSEVVTQELRLRNLLNLPPSGGGKLVPSTDPTTQRVRTTPTESYFVALDNRPEIARQRLNVNIRRLEVLVADNQKRPDLDLTALYRLNGLGKDLGDALDQMVAADFTDVEFGVTLAMPIGLRQKTAEAQQARYRLARDRRLLEQEMFSVSHQISEASQRIDFAYREYEKAKLRLEAAQGWVEGARLRYMNPEPDTSGANWMLQYLDEYLRALRFQTDAAIDVAASLNRYNIELVLYEEIKGTLLEFFAVEYAADPCQQVKRLPKPGARRPPVMVNAMQDAQRTPAAGQPLLEPLQESMPGGTGPDASNVEELPLPTPVPMPMPKSPQTSIGDQSRLPVPAGAGVSSGVQLSLPVPEPARTTTPNKLSLQP